MAACADHRTGFFPRRGGLPVAGRAVVVIDVHHVRFGRVLQAHELGGLVFLIRKMAGRTLLAFLGKGQGVLLVQVNHRGPLQFAELLETVDPNDVGPGLVGIVGNQGGAVHAKNSQGQNDHGRRQRNSGPAPHKSVLPCGLAHGNVLISP